MNTEEFKREIESLGINYTEEILQLLESYCNLLLEYNLHTNLTAIRNKDDVYLKHFYDSLTLVKCIDFHSISTVLDIGSGAGFPGIILKIFFPHLNITLIDSNNKKTTFLKFVVDKLKLTNIHIVYDRVENFTPVHLNHFDLVTARAVTHLRVLSELALPLVKKEGYFVAMKGNVDEELKMSNSTISVLGGEIVNQCNFQLFCNNGERSLIKIIKRRNTEENELRPYEKIIKKPLQMETK